MKTLYIERSTGECRKGEWVEKLDLEGVERIVVGTGPGSFAGIRSAIAFAQGYALGKPGIEVLGLPSACAIAAEIGGKVAVIGDARQGKIWIAIFDGFNLLKEVFQVDSSEVAKSVPDDFKVVTQDEVRIGEMLKGIFGDRYLGGKFPTAEGLKVFAEANPKILVKEPLPIYLNPAVRN